MKIALNSIYNPIFPSRETIRDFFSLPTFIFISILVLITVGFWNMYNKEYPTQPTPLEPNMYSTIRDITNSKDIILNQSVTLGNVGIIDKIQENSFIVSDGESILLVIVPKQISQDTVTQKISKIPEFFTIRGKIRALDENAIHKYQLSLDNNPLVKKQKLYLEISQAPEINFLNPEDELWNSAESI
ncbi:MAG: hypothetical protein Q7S37_04300 [bacterium]|nr:hypothetical protein [bacterium]